MLCAMYPSAGREALVGLPSRTVSLERTGSPPAMQVKGSGARVILESDASLVGLGNPGLQGCQAQARMGSALSALLVISERPVLQARVEVRGRVVAAAVVRGARLVAMAPAGAEAAPEAAVARGVRAGWPAGRALRLLA